MKKLTWTLCVLLVGSVLGAATTGCGHTSTQTNLDTQAVPPSNPNAQPEVNPNKRRPPAPPSMGQPPQSK